MSIFLDLKILNRYVKYVFHAWIRTYVCKRYQFLNISKLFIIITLVGKLSYIISQWAKIRKEIAIQLLAIYTTVCFKIQNLWLFKIFSKTEHPNSSSKVKRIYEVKKRCQKASIYINKSCNQGQLIDTYYIMIIYYCIFPHFQSHMYSLLRLMMSNGFWYLTLFPKINIAQFRYMNL